jgi:CRISPR/Cas system-associated endonuclease Cas1
MAAGGQMRPTGRKMGRLLAQQVIDGKLSPEEALRQNREYREKLFDQIDDHIARIEEKKEKRQQEDEP